MADMIMEGQVKNLQEEIAKGGFGPVPGEGIAGYDRKLLVPRDDRTLHLIQIVRCSLAPKSLDIPMIAPRPSLSCWKAKASSLWTATGVSRSKLETYSTPILNRFMGSETGAIR